MPRKFRGRFISGGLGVRLGSCQRASGRIRADRRGLR
jgi:hypothetical protein